MCIKKTQKNLFSIHLAEQQISGRGRNNRKWGSPHGKNIYISLGWKSRLIHSQLEGLSLAVATSLVSSLKEFTSSDLKIKWPNDLFINKKKISGILIETTDSENGLDVVIGIGINVTSNPKVKAKYETTNILSETQNEIKIRKIINA